jgi:2-succinyl-6-hydroxy-2,4-cyclohexadiene-1-carboxylate synthase
VNGFVPAGGHRLAVQVEGAGSPVLLLHGFTGSGATLAGVARALRDRHLCVSVDLPGHGRSLGAVDPVAWGFEPTLDALCTLLDALGLPAAHVLGYSLGGRLALGLAALRPARVRSAVLVGASAGIADAEARAERARADEALARDLERDGIEPFVERWLALPLFASQRGRVGEAHWRAARAQRLANDPRALARSLRGLGTGVQPPLHDRLASVSAPVLLVAGAEDAKFLAIARELVARLPGAELAEIPEAGHAAQLENPVAFAAAARAFLARADAGRAEPRPEEDLHP